MLLCPKCGSAEYYALKTRKVLKCKKCPTQFSVTSDTVLRYRKLPLDTYKRLLALLLVYSRDGGISVHRLSKTAAISYKGAQQLIHRIFSALVAKNAGDCRHLDMPPKLSGVAISVCEDCGTVMLYYNNRWTPTFIRMKADFKDDDVISAILKVGAP